MPVRGQLLTMDPSFSVLSYWSKNLHFFFI